MCGIVQYRAGFHIHFAFRISRLRIHVSHVVTLKYTDYYYIILTVLGGVSILCYSEWPLSILVLHNNSDVRYYGL